MKKNVLVPALGRTFDCEYHAYEDPSTGTSWTIEIEKIELVDGPPIDLNNLPSKDLEAIEEAILDIHLDDLNKADPLDYFE